METVKASLLEWGVAVAALPGESECGDRYLVRQFRQGALVAVVDGLGHGTEAAHAAGLAIASLARKPRDSVITLLRLCHERLRSTRGAVMSLASFNRSDETMTWLGIGNVEMTLIRAGPDGHHSYESPILRGGVVGSQLPSLNASLIPVTPGDTLILVTDGVESGFTRELPLSSTPQQIAEHILRRHNKRTDDSLALVARYAGAGPCR